ncbi:MAG: hypothetical protein HYT81_11670 [Gemmatimonadetes bacterium]|nr:hypothetical protein [Gemmatimonadota bacterium]
MNLRLGGFGLLTLAALAAGSCSSGPVAGELTISLVTPNSDDGAIVVRVTASESKEITSVTLACSGCKLFKEQPSATELRAVLTGDLVAGPLLRVSVTDTKEPSSYTAQITALASRTYQVRSPSGYSLTIQ